MPIKQTSRYCKTCQRRTLHQATSFSSLAGIALSLLTLGAFLPIWVLLMLGDAIRPWRCQQCGSGKMF